MTDIAMSDTPERIWLDWPGANRGEPVYNEPPERDTQAGQTGYIRMDIAQAQIDAAVKAERERIAAMIEATVYTNNGPVRSLEPISPALVGMDMHHATIAAAIRKGDQP